MTARDTLKPIGIGLAVAVAVAVPWSAIVVLDLRLSPRAPWAVPVGVVYACLAFAYLAGRGWPASTSAARQRDFRARPLGAVVLGWALLAGLAAVVSLWLAYAAAGYLSAQSAQRSPVDWPPAMLLSAVVVGAAVTAIAEEGGFRGFMQAPLERLLGPVPAIAITTVLFVLVHLTHGAAALARNGPFYLAAGCVYGLLAYLTQSILPSLILHCCGDSFVFALSSSLVHITVPEGGARATLAIAALIAADGAVAAFVRLARLTVGSRPGPMRSGSRGIG